MVYMTEPRDDSEAWKGTDPSAARTDGGTGSDADADPAGDEALVRELQLAFAPIHKRAFGTAVGFALALLVSGITVFHLVIDPETSGPLRLLDRYFYGYTVSVAGVLIGAFWGFVVGFVGGWFVAFCRNLAIAISVFVTRTRAELTETREFLDHI